MPDLDLDQLRRVAEVLPAVFYFLLFVAFVCAVTGSPGIGLVFLILGGAVHVGRCGVEATIAEPGATR